MARATKATKKEKRWSTPDYAKKIIARGKKAKDIIVTHGKERIYLAFDRHCLVGIPKTSRNLTHADIIDGIGIREHLDNPAMYTRGEKKGTWIHEKSFAPDCDGFFTKETTSVQVFDILCEIDDKTPTAVFYTDGMFGFIDKEYKDILKSVNKNNIRTNGTTSGFVWSESEDRVVFGAMPFNIGDEKKSKILEDFYRLSKAVL